MSEYISREELIRKITERRIANSMCLASDKAKPPEQTYFKHLLFEDDRALEIAKEIPTAEVIPLDRIKQAREEVANYSDFHREHLYKTNPNYDVEQGQYLAYEKCLQIIDEVIAEEEGKE